MRDRLKQQMAIRFGSHRVLLGYGAHQVYLHQSVP
jgi:hypothetical protein